MVADPPPVRVALVNDYDLVVQGLRRMIEPFLDRIDLVELDSRRPVARPVDIVLYDTFAQDHTDRSKVEQILQDGSGDKVVLFSWNVHEDLVRGALDAGASGYLSKGMPASDLVAALEDIHRGEQVTDEREAPEDAGTDWPGRAEGLSAREAEVLALITRGFTNDEIAKRTYLSINSVKSYIRGAYRKIGVTRRTQAVLWGIEHGFRPDTVRRPGPDA